MLHEILPSSISLVIATEEMGYRKLSQVEELFILNSSPKRKFEFRSGRHCAKKSLELLADFNNVIIPVGDMREPIWPKGFTGAISHTDKYCAAITAHIGDFESVGMDVEGSEPLDPDLIELVCLNKELEQSTKKLNKANLAKLIFCIKESIYKAYYPLYHVFINFHDAEVMLNEFTKTFKAEISNAEGLPNLKCSGTYNYDKSFVYSFVGIKPKGNSSTNSPN